MFIVERGIVKHLEWCIPFHSAYRIEGLSPADSEGRSVSGLLMSRQSRFHLTEGLVHEWLPLDEIRKKTPLSDLPES